MHAPDAGLPQQANHTLNPKGIRAGGKTDSGVYNDEQARVMPMSLEVLKQRGARYINHMMKIQMAIHKYPPAGSWGGLEKRLRQEAEEQRQQTGYYPKLNPSGALPLRAGQNFFREQVRRNKRLSPSLP